MEAKEIQCLCGHRLGTHHFVTHDVCLQPGCRCMRFVEKQAELFDTSSEHETAGVPRLRFSYT